MYTVRMNKLLTLIGILVIAAGGWYAYQNVGGPGAEPGSYAYQCDNDVQFSLTPAEDFSWVAISPGENATFLPQTLSYRDNTMGPRYMGTDVEITGSGENVILGRATGTTSCALAEGSERMDWNADTTDVGQNLALTMSESIVGKWQGIGDTNFAREFKPDGTYTDIRANGTRSGGLWFAFTAKNPPPVAFPLEENRVYLQLADADGAISYVQITSLTLTELNLVYMDRPGILMFRLVQ
jgi:hypothetical protein